MLIVGISIFQSFKYKQYGKQGESLNLIPMTPNDLIDRPDAGFSRLSQNLSITIEI